MTRPVLVVTNHVPPDRVGALQALNEIEPLEVAIYGGRLHHGAAGVDDPGVPFRRLGQSAVLGAAASGDYRAVIASSAGRIALPSAYLGARKANVPFIYWTGIWHQVATPTHLAAAPLVRWIESHADAVIAYGPHVANYVAGHGAANVHVAPQAVDRDFWSQPGNGKVLRAALGDPEFLVGVAARDAPGKGLQTALAAWREGGLGDLAVAGTAAHEIEGQDAVHALGALNPEQMRDLYAAADLWIVPSLATRAFKEPWGLVVNEAIHQGTPLVASDAVGAVAGGLIVDGKNGLVFAGGDAAGLAAAVKRLKGDAELRRRLAAEATRSIGSYSFESWAQACSQALASVSAGRGGC
uniref:Unannotated protein n=1 Tax=freshwater metagenome TaxID=449393 RepID=A0A6J5Z5P3_9ZZZZ